MTHQSESIADLAAALAAAQGEIRNPEKNKVVERFKGSSSYSYADLAEVLDVARETLSKHGLAVVQTGAGTRAEPTLRTMLVHKSGEWIAGEMPIPGDLATIKPQDLGSLLTYLRRYSLSAIVGIAQEDDDGQAAQGQRKDERRQERRQSSPQQQAPPAAKVNGNGHAEPPGKAPSKSKCRAWFEDIVSEANHHWSAMLSEIGKDKQYKDVANLFELCNHLVNDWIVRGMMTADDVSTDGKRDNSKVWSSVKAAWEDDRPATEGEAKDYLHANLVAAAKVASINLDSEPKEAPARAS